MTGEVGEFFQKGGGDKRPLSHSALFLGGVDTILEEWGLICPLALGGPSKKKLWQFKKRETTEKARGGEEGQEKELLPKTHAVDAEGRNRGEGEKTWSKKTEEGKQIIYSSLERVRR